MPKAFETWTVLEHDPLETLTDNLWYVTGRLPNMALRRTMALARMEDGRVVIHNPIALEEEAMKSIEEWGTPAFIVVPSGFHRLDCAAFKRRYPDAKVVCPAGSRARVEQVVSVDLTYDEFAGDDSVSFEHIDGVKQFEGVMKVRSADGVTLVFNDVVFNVPHQPGRRGLLLRLIGSSGGPKVTRLARMFIVKDKKAVRACIQRLAETPELARVIPGHGLVIDQDAPAVLKEVVARL